MTLHIDSLFQQLLPSLSPEEKKLLEESLRVEGCRDALIVWEEETGVPLILDGHNRYEICTRLGIPFDTIKAKGVQTREDAIRWIGVNQLGRRNLDASRKAAFALELEKQLAVEAKKRQAAAAQLTNAKLGRGKQTVTEKIPEASKGEARVQAAQLVGVNERYISDAKKIQAAAPEVLEEVKRGGLTIPQAKQVAELSQAERPAAIERAKAGEAIIPGGLIYKNGQHVPVETNAEVEAAQQQLFGVIEAIEALSALPCTPEEYLKDLPPYADYLLDVHLTPALRWLTTLHQLWEAHHAHAA